LQCCGERAADDTGGWMRLRRRLAEQERVQDVRKRRTFGARVKRHHQRRDEVSAHAERTRRLHRDALNSCRLPEMRKVLLFFAWVGCLALRVAVTACDDEGSAPDGPADAGRRDGGGGGGGGPEFCLDPSLPCVHYDSQDVNACGTIVLKCTT